MKRETPLVLDDKTYDDAELEPRPSQEFLDWYNSLCDKIMTADDQTVAFMSKSIVLTSEKLNVTLTLDGKTECYRDRSGEVPFDVWIFKNRPNVVTTFWITDGTNKRSSEVPFLDQKSA